MVFRVTLYYNTSVIGSATSFALREALVQWCRIALLSAASGILQPRNYTLEAAICLLRAHAGDSTGYRFSLTLEVLRHEKGCIWP